MIATIQVIRVELSSGKVCGRICFQLKAFFKWSETQLQKNNT